MAVLYGPNSLAALHLISYQSTCQEDPKFESFNSSLQQRTSDFVSWLAAPEKTENSSLDSIMQLSGFLADQTQCLVNFFNESREDFWMNEDLRSLVRLYLDGTANTLNLFDTVEKGVTKAESSLFCIQIAINHFESESSDLGGNNKKNKYAQTLEELKKIKSMGDPFGDEFKTQLASVCKKQESFLGELGKLKEKLDKKNKWVTWKKYSDLIFATALYSCFAISLVSLLLGQQHVADMAKGLASLIRTSSFWLNGIWKKFENVWNIQKDLVSEIERRADVNNITMENIKLRINELTTSMLPILKNAEAALDRVEVEFATKHAMKKIMQHVEGFTEKIEEVSKCVGTHRKLIIEGREEVLHRVAKPKGK